jgi:hypothetical protein
VFIPKKDQIVQISVLDAEFVTRFELVGIMPLKKEEVKKNKQK